MFATVFLKMEHNISHTPFCIPFLLLIFQLSEGLVDYSEEGAAGAVCTICNQTHCFQFEVEQNMNQKRVALVISLTLWEF